MLSESNDIASSQQENVHQTHVVERLADVELQPLRYKNTRKVHQQACNVLQIHTGQPWPVCC